MSRSHVGSGKILRFISRVLLPVELILINSLMILLILLPLMLKEIKPGNFTVLSKYYIDASVNFVAPEPMSIILYKFVKYL